MMILSIAATGLAMIGPLSPVTVTADRDDLAKVMRELDDGFVCPQFLPSDAERETEIAQFSIALAGIGLSYEDAIKVRRAILARHHCIRQRAPSA
jgi:hypothetical protein